MKQKTVCFMLLLLYFTTSFSQNLVSGRVTSARQEALEGVHVKLLQLPDSVFIAGTATDSQGNFSLKIERRETPDFLLLFSAIGYAENTIAIHRSNNQSIHTGTVTLNSVDVELDEVTVVASQYARKHDKIMIFPDSKQVKYAATGYDLLANLMIPGINVDRLQKTVTTMGGAATLYINGIQATFQEVQALRPKDIMRVDYHDTPQGKFVKDIVAIDYITKQYDYGGYVAIMGEQRMAYWYGDYMLTAKLNKKKTVYTAIAGYKSDDNLTERQVDEQIHIGKELVDREGMNKEEQKNRLGYFMFNWSTLLGKANLMAQLGFNRLDLPDQYKNNHIRYANPDATSTACERMNQTSNRPYLSLNFYYPFTQKQWLMVQTSASYTKNKYTRDYTEKLSSSADTYDYQMHTDEDYTRFNGDITYQWIFDKSNSLTANLYHVQNITSSEYRGTIQQNIHLSSGETMLRLTYGQTFAKKLFLQLVLGGSMNVYSLRHEISRTTFSPRPSFSMRYTINPKHTLNFSGYMSNSFPTLSILSTIDQPVDWIQIKRGNPDLGLVKFIQSSVRYTYLSGKLNLTAGLFYEGMFNLTKNNYYIENNKLIQSFLSDGNQHALSPNVSSSVSLLNQKMRVSLNAGFYHTAVTGRYAMSQNDWRVKATVNYFAKAFSIQAYYASPQRAISNAPLYYKFPADYGLSVGYFVNGWAFEVGTSRPFAKSDNEITRFASDTYSYHRKIVENKYRPMAYIKLNYSFDFGRGMKKSEVNVDKQINSAIFK